MNLDDIINTIDTIAKKHHRHIKDRINNLILIGCNDIHTDTIIYINIGEKTVFASSYYEDISLTLSDIKMVFDIYKTLGWLDEDKE